MDRKRSSDFTDDDFSFIYDASRGYDSRQEKDLKDIEKTTDSEEECSLPFLSNPNNKNVVIQNLKDFVFKVKDFKSYSDKLQNTVMGSISLISRL